MGLKLLSKSCKNTIFLFCFFVRVVRVRDNGSKNKDLSSCSRMGQDTKISKQLIIRRSTDVTVETTPWTTPGLAVTRGRYHGGRRPSSDDSVHSPTVIPPSTLDRPSSMKRYHRRRTTRRGVTARSPTMDHLVGLVVKASASRAGDPGFESRLRRDFFRGRVIPVT